MRLSVSEADDSQEEIGPLAGNSRGKSAMITLTAKRNNLRGTFGYTLRERGCAIKTSGNDEV